MPTDWVEVKLEDVASELTVGYVGSMTSEYAESGIPFLRSKNVDSLSINTDDLKYITEEFHQRISKSRLSPGDVVIVRTGKPGTCAVVPDWLEEANCSDLVIVRCGPKINNRFLSYYVNTVASSHVNAHLVGAVQQHFNVGSARTMKVNLPPLSEQERIAGVLGSLDDKIELNRQMNATLEAMAQALFKSWFVDFDPVIDNALAAGNPIPEPLHARAEVRAALGDQRKPLPAAIQQQFPSRFVFIEEMGWVPEGWAVEPLDEVIELIGGGTPKTSVDEYWGGDIPWFSVVDAPNPSDVFVLNTEKSITQEGLNNSSARLLPKGTTIISARGTVGKCAVVARPMAMNQSCYGIRGINGMTDYFVYYTVLLRVADLQLRGHGSVFNTITRDTFKTIKTCVPSTQLSDLYDETVSPYMDRIASNLAQVDGLSQTRDALLPKLLSGQLRIPDAEKRLAEAI